MPGTGVTGSSQGPMIRAIGSAHARLLMLCRCSRATSCTAETVLLVHLAMRSSFSSHCGTLPEMECCATLACVQRAVHR